jgi:azurin
VKIGTVNERMQFTVTEFKVKAGTPVKIVFDNPDATPHNLLIVQPGAVDEIGLAAIEMAKQPEALVSLDFTPKSDKILQGTKMIKQGETDVLRFNAPTERGSYPYICSFPGHFLVMKGVMIVE